MGRLLTRDWVGGQVADARLYATRFRNGRTVSCIPIARRTALKLLSSGFPLGRACGTGYWRSNSPFPQVFVRRQKPRTFGVTRALVPLDLRLPRQSSNILRQTLDLYGNSLPWPVRGYGMVLIL